MCILFEKSVDSCYNTISNKSDIEATGMGENGWGIERLSESRHNCGCKGYNVYGGNAMNSRRTALAAEVREYEVGKGLEDGFERWSEVVTKGWIVTDFLVKITKPDGMIVCPFILTRRGRVFIGEGDYIVIDEDGSKHVCGADKIWKRYEKPEDLD